VGVIDLPTLTPTMMMMVCKSRDSVHYGKRR